MNIKNMTLGFASIALLLGLTGCGGSSATEESESTSTTGSLSVQLTDAPGDYSAVYVTIDEIRVHKAYDDDSSDDNETDDDSSDSNTTDVDSIDDDLIEDGNSTDSTTDDDSTDDDSSDDSSDDDSSDDNKTDSSWIVVAQPHKTYNLLELQNGLTEEIGEANLSAGKYTQVRLVLGEQEDNGTNILGNPHPYAHYVIFADGSDFSKLKVPSNVIKLKHNFEVYPDTQTVLTLDFDANKSVVEAGNSGKYILKPVIGLEHALDESDSDDEIDSEDEADNDDDTDSEDEVDSEDETDSEDESDTNSTDDSTDTNTTL